MFLINSVHMAFKRPRGPDEECHSFDDFNEHKKAKFTSQIPACLRILLPSKVRFNRWSYV